jgi:thiol-disulfide isomerase/thioredoxin
VATSSPPGSSPPPAPQKPRYRGLSGAIAYAVMLSVLGLFLALVAGVTLWLATGNRPAAMHLAGRAALVCAAAGVAAGLSRLICGGESDRLLTLRFVKGDFGGILGFLVALVLVGYFTEERLGLSPATGTGAPVEVAGPTLGGGRFSLADQRGQVVLVDFWASWCGYCVAELPRLRKLHEKYHGDGLRVVGVSLDVTRPALEKFLKDNPLPWPHIYYDEDGKRFRDNPVARQFNVKAIPSVMVIDREGKVVERGIHGVAVERAVARALGKSAPVTPTDPLRRWFTGVMYAPWWLLLGCCVGAAGLLALLEAGLRLLSRKRLVSPPTPAR